MTIIDISVRLGVGVATWPTSSGFTLRTDRWEQEGDLITNSRLETDVHCGTHVEAPRHFLGDGASLEAMGLAPLVGPVTVTGVPENVEVVDAAVLDWLLEVPPSTSRLLLRTANRHWWPAGREFRDDFVGLDESGARWCVDHGLQLVGIDYLSIQSRRASAETHRVLFRGGSVVLEGVDLRSVEPGTYELICLPLRLAEAEAAPARAILRPLGLEETA